MKIDLPLEARGQFILVTEKHQPGMLARQVFDEHIEVACRREIIAQDGAEPKYASRRMPRFAQKTAISSVSN